MTDETDTAAYQIADLSDHVERLTAALAVALLGLKLIADKTALDPDKTAVFVLNHLAERYGVTPDNP